MTAKWTPEQVAALNVEQQREDRHPLTCGNNRGDATHVRYHETYKTRDLGLLVATGDGWICMSCDYRQGWSVEALERALLEDDRIAVDPIGYLSDCLRDAGIAPTWDRRRNSTHPCWRCGTTSEPRDLVEIGRYTRFVGGNLKPGDAITRPLCAACVAATETPTEVGA